jgi:hypothetical protein
VLLISSFLFRTQYCKKDPNEKVVLSYTTKNEKLKRGFGMVFYICHPSCGWGGRGRTTAVQDWPPARLYLKDN